MSKQSRIITLLIIDSVFFFIELFGGAHPPPLLALSLALTDHPLLRPSFSSPGYAVGSIALVAGEFLLLSVVSGASGYERGVVLVVDHARGCPLRRFPTLATQEKLSSPSLPLAQNPDADKRCILDPLRQTRSTC